MDEQEKARRAQWPGGVKPHETSRLNLYDMRPLPRDDERPGIWVLAWTWYDARSLAQSFYPGLGYDQIGGGTHAREQAIAEGELILVSDEKGRVETFQATRDTDSTWFGREDHFRLWKPVAQQGGRDLEEVPGGVQDDGEEELLSNEYDMGYDQKARAEEREEASHAGGVFGDREEVGGSLLGRLLGAGRAGLREWSRRRWDR